MTDQTSFPNRRIQHEILQKLAAAYPGNADVQRWDYPNLAAEIHYLHEHGLAAVRFSGELGQRVPQPVFAKLTAKGVDFLQQDGGLSAILGVVTVKLHEETLRQMLEAAVSKSDISPEEQSSLKKAIRNLPAKAIEKVIDKVLDLGVAHLPGAIPQLHMWLSQAAG